MSDDKNTPVIIQGKFRTYKTGRRGNYKPRSKCSTKQKAFIEQFLANGGVKFQAAKTMGLPYNTILQWFKHKYFMDELNAADQSFTDALRDVARRRALSRSDTLLIFLCKANWPEIFDDNYRKIKWEKEATEELQKKFPLPRLEMVVSLPLEKPIDVENT